MNGKEIIKVEPVRELFEQIKGMSDEERDKLRSLLGTNISIFLCGSAANNGGISIQINDKDSLKDALEKIPPEALAEILRAIADMVASRRV